jgi:hypothetical protein
MLWREILAHIILASVCIAVDVVFMEIVHSIFMMFLQLEMPPRLMIDICEFVVLAIRVFIIGGCCEIKDISIV